jgi:tight adherence protein C
MKEVSRRLPYAIDLLSLSMGAGLDFPGAVRQVVDKSGTTNDPVVEEFTLILQSLQLGRTRRSALEAFAERVPVEGAVEFVGAMVQAELRGNPVVDVLRIQAEVARRKRTVRAEESAAKAGAAMMGPLVLVFLSIMILIIAPIVMKLQM